MPATVTAINNRIAIQPSALGQTGQPTEQLLHKGDVLYWMGEELPGVFLIRAGAIKAYRVSKSGEQQILGFYLPGDIIGLDALNSGTSRSCAEALDTTRVEMIPESAFTSRRCILDLSEVLTKLTQVVNREQDLALILSQRAADRRVAWYLREFARSQEDRGYSPKEFSLPMSRTDLAQFLGLALETICRELAKFSEQGIIEKKRRTIRIIDPVKLDQLAEGVGEDDSDFAQPLRSATKH